MLQRNATHNARFAKLILLVTAVAACDEVPVIGGPDTGTAPDVIERDTGGSDTPDEDVNDEDVAEDADAEDADAVESDATEDTVQDAADAADSGDADAGSDVDPACDQDGDGQLSEECGGDDCDDSSVRIGPHVRETCDYIDNNCDGRVNEGIECSFFAHTADELYEINPFSRSLVYVTDVPDLWDFDTSTDGTLWGISRDTLWRFDSTTRQWVDDASLADFGSEPNGFAINSRSQAFATGENELFEINLEDGTWERVGSMGGGYISSGDCVVDKADTLFMTSDHLEDTDVLVRIDSATGVASAVGEVGTSRIYGLTAAWGFMFGVTSAGELVEINSATGEGEVIHVFEDKRWYGAASTPAR